MPIENLPYNRRAAVEYAHRWAYRRNPDYYDYENIGGDCTNFASQALYAGSKVMNFTPTFGWYYIDANQKSPSWTGVPYFYAFMTRTELTPGPFGIGGERVPVWPGDFVQLKYGGEGYEHTLIVVETGMPGDRSQILVAAHSQDADYRPLTDYDYSQVRFIHIRGAYSDL